MRIFHGFRGKIATYGTNILNYRLGYPAESEKFNATFTYTVLISGLFWFALITAINVAAVGYELVPFISSSFNGSANLWYEGFLPDIWKPVTSSCEPKIFPLGQSSLSIFATEIGLTTNMPGFWVYKLVDFVDARAGVPVEEMIYHQTNIQNCSVTSISMSSTNPFGLGQAFQSSLDSY